MSGALVEVTSRQEWDTLVQANPQQHLLQSWSWGELKGRFGWRPVRLCARDEHGNAALAQVLIQRRLGLSALYVPRGPLWADDTCLNKLLLHGLRRLARSLRAVFLRLEPNLLADSPAGSQLHSFLLLQGLEPVDPLQPRTSIHLDLAPTIDELLAGMRKGHRADIKRAGKKGVAVRAGAAPGDLDVFYSLLRETAQRAGFAVHSRDYYSTAWQLFSEADADASRLLLAEIEGRPVASFLVFAWGQEAHYMYSASSEDALRSGANHLLQLEAIRWARERGCRRYDFWGIPDALGEAALAEDPIERDRLEEEGKAHPLAGVYRFKKGFGGQVRRYLPAYDHVLIRPAYWLWQRRRRD